MTVINYAKPRTLAQNKKLWQAAHELWADHETAAEMVAALTEQHTGGRTRSTKALTVAECDALIADIAGRLDEGKRRMRGKIIHLLCTLPANPMVDASGNADYVRINNFIQNIGSLNPKRKILNYLYYGELLPVVSQVQALYEKEMKTFAQK
jgi:hypothetical protein